MHSYAGWFFFGRVYSCEHEHNFESQLQYRTQTNVAINMEFMKKKEPSLTADT